MRVLDPELTAVGDVGRIVVTVLGMVAEMERKFILERQRAGIEAARARGIYAGVGRLKSVPDAEIRRRHAEGEGPTAIARALGVGRISVYRALGVKAVSSKLYAIPAPASTAWSSVAAPASTKRGSTSSASL